MQRYPPSGTEYCQVRVTKVGPSTQMVVFGMGTGCGSLANRCERGDP